MCEAVLQRQGWLTIAGRLKPKFAIPIHYGTIPVLKGTPAEYIAALGASSTKVITMNPGDKVEF